MAKVKNELHSFLKDFGLTDKEIQLYLTLLKTGPNSIMNLARETGIKRSTTHNNVEELINKGLVSQTNYGERRQVVAESPEKLKFLIEQKKWTVQKLETNLDGVVAMIDMMVPREEQKTEVEVKYYSGQEGVKYIYDLSLKAQKVYSFINLDKYYEAFPGTEDMFTEAFKKNPNRHVYDIAVDSELARKIAKSHKQYSCKLVPTLKYFSGVDILIFDNKVAIIQLEKENIIGTIITSELINTSMVALHQTMWELV